MAPPIRIVSPDIVVPTLDAPPLKPVDVSSGLDSVAEGLAEVARVERIAKANEAQIAISSGFRRIDDEVRSTPPDQKRELFDERAAQLHKNVFGAIDDNKVRDSVRSDFQRSYGLFGGRAAADAFSGQTTNALANADAETEELTKQIATARAPHERDAL